jgi:predicted O-methyltransferase YrrM
MNIEKIAEIARGVQGWLYPESGRRLYRLAQEAPIPVAVELGSWRGLSTIWIAGGLCERDGVLYAIDTWRGTPGEELHQRIIEDLGGSSALYDEFCANIARAEVGNRVTTIVRDTIEASRDSSVPESIGLLHIDAGHEYAEVLADYLAWAPRVVPGGFVVFDDVPGWPGPSRVAREIASQELEFIEESHNQWIGKKQ